MLARWSAKIGVSPSCVRTVNDATVLSPFREGFPSIIIGHTFMIEFIGVLYGFRVRVCFIRYLHTFSLVLHEIIPYLRFRVIGIDPGITQHASIRGDQETGKNQDFIHWSSITIIWAWGNIFRIVYNRVNIIKIIRSGSILIFYSELYTDPDFLK
jgi:hypothetical protein